VIMGPGLNPTSPPLMTDGPVLVTVEPPRTAKLPAVPRIGFAEALDAAAIWKRAEAAAQRRHVLTLLMRFIPS
jgi:hypothetical protein